jgi:hypothetical protein
MVTTYRAATDIDVLTSSFPIPGCGQFPDRPRRRLRCQRGTCLSGRGRRPR